MTKPNADTVVIIDEVDQILSKNSFKVEEIQ
jgi:hypothetical protein